MKFIPFLFMLLASLHTDAQSRGDSIIGSWLKTPKNDMIIEVYNTHGKYEARIKWARDSVKRPVGYVILKNLEYDAEENAWKNGTITDPSSQNTYSASIAKTEDGTLELFAYKGIKLFGAKRYFKRVN